MLNVLRESAAYPPAPDALSSNLRSKLPRALPAACIADESWSYARARAERDQRLRVGIIGCSTTAGCGARSPESKFCSAPLSWGRRAHDALVDRATVAHIHNGSASSTASAIGMRVESNIFYKNAVEAEFFWDWYPLPAEPKTLPHAPSDGLGFDLVRSSPALYLPPRPHGTDVVLLDLLQNVYAWPLPQMVNATIAAIRRAAPHAAIAFIGWIKPSKLRGYRALPPEIARAVIAGGGALVDVPAALKTLGLAYTEVSPATTDTFASLHTQPPQLWCSSPLTFRSNFPW